MKNIWAVTQEPAPGRAPLSERAIAALVERLAETVPENPIFSETIIPMVPSAALQRPTRPRKRWALGMAVASLLAITISFGIGGSSNHDPLASASKGSTAQAASSSPLTETAKEMSADCTIGPPPPATPQKTVEPEPAEVPVPNPKDRSKLVIIWPSDVSEMMAAARDLADEVEALDTDGRYAILDVSGITPRVVEWTDQPRSAPFRRIRNPRLLGLDDSFVNIRIYTKQSVEDTWKTFVSQHCKPGYDIRASLEINGIGRWGLHFEGLQLKRATATQ